MQLVVNSWARNSEMRVELWCSWLAVNQSARDPRTHAHTISQGLESHYLYSTKIGRARKLIILTHDSPVEF